MNFRKFGNTDLLVSEIGFGAWAIGGPAMVGDLAIGWGNVDDNTSIAALKKSFDFGINFYDTADFYGFGHSEELIGKVFGNRADIIIATKVGHRVENEQILLDYSKQHILKSCDESLKRLKRDYIDFYQLHSAKLNHLEDGQCIEAMEELKSKGKIRYWGISLNTFNPYPEAEFLMNRNFANGFQIAFNIINQRALKLIETASEKGYGIIARIPLQFGLLTGKFTKETKFDKNDHRSFRLNPEFLSELLDALEDVWKISEKYKVDKVTFALSFIMNHKGVSTVIPGIKTPEQAIKNTQPLVEISKEDLDSIHQLFETKFDSLVSKMK
ncbi:MAG: aldo/keto reductase [Ignavibacterium album]|uniref:aldo/keto reductase n=1 Tax=Ignavibacterium album TaxID=591197 RepID=UPI0026F09577|nr:aldo/keto reductase [Ignavibacterium album]MCX8104948.1 aldo/keto reductase [Ignavibacterium album]